MVGSIAIGGGAPISVQSMTNTPTRDFDKTWEQVRALHRAGADIVRVTLNEVAAIPAFERLCKESPVPIVADIHYSVELALAAVKCGAHAIRINPGNLKDKKEVKLVAEACREAGIPVRIGVNMGSLDDNVVQEWGKTPRAMVESALEQASLLEGYDLHDICISVKSSNPQDAYEAYKMLAECADYPLHIGVTEAGGGEMALAKGNAVIGALLLEGIGDTLRFSMTGDPVEEVRAGVRLLRALGLRKDRVEVISCPTCGRTLVDVEGVSKALEAALAEINTYKKVAVMGCVVNGLGEAEDADIAVVGMGAHRWGIFVNGIKIDTCTDDKVITRVLSLLDRK